MKMTESQKVAAAAWRIRRYALQMGEVQGRAISARRWAMPMCSPPPSAMP